MKNEFDYLNDVKMDFSIYDEESITETESIKMKNKKAFKKPCLIAACVTVIALTGTAFASGFVSNVIKTFTTGHNKFIVTDSSTQMDMPEVLKGKLYDKDGNMLTSIKPDNDGGHLNELYDADGNKLTKEDIKQIYIDAYGDELVEIAFADEKADESAKTVYKTIEEAEADVSFDIKVPSYMPEGYMLDSIECYNNNEGKPSGDYRTLIYKNTKGNTIYFFERIINDETAFESGGTEEMEEIKINGRTAVIDRTTLDWETADDVSVGISVHDNSITRDELIKIGENTK